MNEGLFVEKKEPSWKRLVWLCDRADLGLRNLTPEEFREFVSLYRQTSADLSLIQTGSANVPLQEFLNDVVARAYSILYRSRRTKLGEALRNGLATAAQTVRRRAWFVFVSVAIFVVSILFVYNTMDAVPAARDVFISPGDEVNIKAWTEGKMDRSTDQSISAWAMYAQHNPVAAIMGSSLAASSFGVGTVYMIYANGAGIAALAHEMHKVGKLPKLVIWLLPHGVTEISGFILSATAGFVLAWALIRPGPYSRIESVRRAGKDGIVLMGTAVVMMFLAAPVEGFFSFNSRVPDGLKLAFAATMACAWAAFWLGYGHPPAPTPSRTGLALDNEGDGD